MLLLRSVSQIPTKPPAKNEKRQGIFRSIWSFLKSPEPVAKLAELDEVNPDILISKMAPDRMIASVKRISPEEFHAQYRLLNKPVIVKGIANTWPAATKWKDPNFFANNFGKSHVPIEVGGHYLDPHWTQKLVTFKDFIQRYITLEDKYEMFPSSVPTSVNC